MLFSHVENKICHWQQRGSNWKFYSKVKGGRYRGRDHILNSDVELRNSGLVGLTNSVPRGKRKDKTGEDERNVTTCKAAAGDKGRILIFQSTEDVGLAAVQHTVQNS